MGRQRALEVAAEADGREHPVQKLPCPTDEGAALQILVAAGRLADHHDARPWVTVAEHRIARALLQVAKVEPGYGLPQRVKA